MGLLNNIFGNKNKETASQESADYIRVNLLAKLGEEKVNDGSFTEAISYINEFFELMNKNDFVDLHHLIKPCDFNIALAYSKKGDYSNAILYWTKYIQSDKSNFDAYFERLQAYFELDKLPEAIQDIETALRLRPNRDDLYINKGIAYIKMGDKLEARKALTRAKELGNTDAESFISQYC